MSDAAATTSFLLYGHAVELGCDVPELAPALDELLGPFRAGPQGRGADSSPSRPARSPPVVGRLLPYNESDVVRRISPAAARVPTPMLGPLRDAAELWASPEGDRIWLVDDRWGLAEIDLLKSRWRAWVVPPSGAAVDPVSCLRQAVLWPVGQLLRGRGLHLLPAASVVRGDWGLLLLAPFDLGPELAELVDAGWRVVGQSWTAVRPIGDQVDLLHLPGQIEAGGPMSWLTSRTTLAASLRVPPKPPDRRTAAPRPPECDHACPERGPAPGALLHGRGFQSAVPLFEMPFAPHPLTTSSADPTSDAGRAPDIAARAGVRPAGVIPARDASRWTDLTLAYPGCGAPSATCSAVVLVQPGRREAAHVRPVPAAESVAAVRAAWPTIEFHPSRRRHGALPAMLAACGPCVEAQLSRDPADFVELLASILASLPAPLTPLPAGQEAWRAPPPARRAG